MTDRFAIELYEKIFVPHTLVRLSRGARAELPGGQRAMARDAVAEVRDAHRHRRHRFPVRPAEEDRALLQGSLSLPPGEDALLRRLSRVGQFPLLRLRQRRRRLHLLHGGRARRVPRRPAGAGASRRRRARHHPQPAAGSRRPSQPAHRAQRAGRLVLHQRAAQHHAPAPPAARSSSNAASRPRSPSVSDSASPPTAMPSAATCSSAASIPRGGRSRHRRGA